MNLSFKTLAFLAFAAVSVVAETHSVRFENHCGAGTPTLAFRDRNIVRGEYTSDGPLTWATAYLQTGACGAQGEGCTSVIIDLKNPDSSASIGLFPPYDFSVPTAFKYSLCGGIGADCDAPNCPDASRGPSDTAHQVACNEDDVSIFVTFC